MNYLELVLFGNITNAAQQEVAAAMEYLGFYVEDIVEYRGEVAMLLPSREEFTRADRMEIEDIMRDEFSDLDYEIRG